MKSFKFQQFEIRQDKRVFRVGTDAVLLGSIVAIEEARSILEVGVGTGIIALMLAQRNLLAKITGVEIDENAYQLAKQNFENSPFAKRLTIHLVDFKQFRPKEKFDHIVCNPPYFPSNSSTKDSVARQRIRLDFYDLFIHSRILHSEKGYLSMIVPSEFGTQIIKTAEENGYYLKSKTSIYGSSKGAVKRLILTWSTAKTEYQEDELIIEKSPRKYSDHYLELTKDFHLFSK